MIWNIFENWTESSKYFCIFQITQLELRFFKWLSDRFDHLNFISRLMRLWFVALSRGSPEPESGQIVGLCSTQLSVIIELYSALFSLRSNVDISLLEEPFMPTLKNSSHRRCSPEMNPLRSPFLRSFGEFLGIPLWSLRENTCLSVGWWVGKEWEIRLGVGNRVTLTGFDGWQTSRPVDRSMDGCQDGQSLQKTKRQPDTQTN